MTETLRELKSRRNRIDKEWEKFTQDCEKKNLEFLTKWTVVSLKIGKLERGIK